MHTITYFSPATRVLHSITTPDRVAAWDALGSLRRAGFVARMWCKGAMVPGLPVRSAR